MTRIVLRRFLHIRPNAAADVDGAMRRRAAALGWGLTTLAWAFSAAAMPDCTGTYAATLLQPLPASVVVGLDIHDRSSGNLKLADRFLAGVRDAGVSVGTPPNVLLHVSTALLGGTSGTPGNKSEKSYSELSGIEGGVHLSLPTMPDTHLAVRRAPPAMPLLVVRVDATEGSATRIAWVASMQCRMTGTDEGQLAQELGRVVGGALGRRVERRPL